MALEPSPPFQSSPERPRPLHHQLSPERFNTRNISVATTASKSSRSETEPDTEYDDIPARTESRSLQPSPTRKANLFADYHPMTPKHANTGFGGLPESPSLPEIGALRSHVRTNSDVQGLVKRFEHLDVRDRDAESVERRRKHEAELRRAQIAREEAESDVKRLREDLRRVKREMDEGRERERRVARRLEVVMEEYTSSKEQHSSQSAVYEKELRRSRKEAYKSSSAVIKLQEELKATRNSLRITQSGLDAEKQKVQRREQDTFNAQYQLAAAQEDLDKLKAQLRIVEEEKVALKQSLKDEEVARVAAEGMIALPPSQDDERDIYNSPGKRPASPLSDDKENAAPMAKRLGEAKKLEDRLIREQRRRREAEEMVDFLEMECKFRCCRCQHAVKRQNTGALQFDVANELPEKLAVIMEGMRAALGSSDGAEAMEVEAQEDASAQSGDAVQDEPAETALVVEEPGSAQEEDLDRSMTLAREQPEEQAPLAPELTPAEPEPAAEAVETLALQPSSPLQTPTQPHHLDPARHHHQTIRTITTTTTIPMHFTPITKPQKIFSEDDAENIPPPPVFDDCASAVDDQPFDRAAALAAIEYRRGRAKSFQAGHLTPRKQMVEGIGVGGRRDISAPALGGKVGVAAGYAKGTGSVGRAGRRGV